MDGVLKTYQRISGFSAFQKYGLLFILGASAALAFPPFSFCPVIIPALTVLLWVITMSTSWRGAFAAGWWFGFGHFIAGIYWIAIALLTDPDQYGWLVPFAVFGIAAALAIYIGLVALLTYLVPVQDAGKKVLVFAVIWVLAEMLRGVLFTGFPWNLMGYVWVGSIKVMQFAAVTGIWGLSFVAVLVGSAASALVSKNKEGKVVEGSWNPLILVAMLLVLLWEGGDLRLPEPEDYKPTSVTLKIIQPNITQDHKWKPELRFDTLKRHMDLSKRVSAQIPQLLIWPESAVPYSLDPASDLLAGLKSVIPANGFLLTGAIREEGEDKNYRIWNSLFAIDSKGKIIDSYDKVHLVPFGEYIPLHNLLPITKLTYGVVDFSSGDAAKTLALSPEIPPFGALICYEAIFPEGIINPEKRPSWLLNVTNDAWFGMSTGPYQHFEMVRMRSIEQGLPVVRAANTGISAIIDAYGRITASLPLGRVAVLEGNLPQKISATPYNRYGNYIIFLILSVAGLFLFLTRSHSDSRDA